MPRSCAQSVFVPRFCTYSEPTGPPLGIAYWGALRGCSAKHAKTTVAEYIEYALICEAHISLNRYATDTAKATGRATEVGECVNGAQGIKNRRGELQRVLSREESYVDGKLSRAAFISIAILTFITFVGNFTQLQLSSALPIIVSEFHISVTTGQWLTSVFQLVMGVMVPLTAFLTRRFSTRQIVICSMAVFTIGSVLAWLGPNFVWVLVGRVLEAAGTGVMWPVLQSPCSPSTRCLAAGLPWARWAWP